MCAPARRPKYAEVCGTGLTNLMCALTVSRPSARPPTHLLLFPPLLPRTYLFLYLSAGGQREREVEAYLRFDFMSTVLVYNYFRLLMFSLSAKGNVHTLERNDLLESHVKKTVAEKGKNDEYGHAGTLMQKLDAGAISTGTSCRACV